MRRIALAVVCCVALAATAAGAQTTAGSPRYAGRLVIDVLQELNRAGLRIVFSTVLVKPTLRVLDEPSGPEPADVLAQILGPHGLTAHRRSNGIFIVARSPRPAPQPRALPGPVSVRGRVVDAASEEPLSEVLVVASRPARRTTTAGDGTFVLEGLEAGVQQLYISLVGYALARPEVVVPDAGTIEILVTLSAGTGAYTESLTVTAATDAGASSAPSQFSVGSAELQQLRGVLAEDPLRALQSMPAAATGDDFRSEFTVRGSPLRQMGFTLDGTPVPWLVHQVQQVEDSGSIAMVNADVLDRVTLTAGAAPQTYGNRIGARVDTVMREGSRDAFRASGSLSATGVSTVLEGPLARGRGSWLVSARQSYIDWLIARLHAEDTATFGFSDAQAKLVVDLSPSHQIQFTAVGGRSALRERDDEPAPNGIADGRSATGVAIASWRATLGSSLLLTQRLALSGTRFRNTNAFDQELAAGRGWTWTYRSEAEWSPSPAVAVRAAGSVDRDWFTIRQEEYRGVSDAPPLLRSWNTATLGRWRQGAVAAITVGPVPAASLDAGLRLDREGIGRTTQWSPWILARWRAAPRWTVRAGWARASQAPDLVQAAVTRDTLRPERARSVDASLAYAPTPAVRIQVNAFDRRETDGLFLDAPAPRLTGGTPVTPFASRQWSNARNVHARGVEVFLRRTSARGLSGWVAYSYGRTQDTNTLSGERYWGDFDQRHALNLYGSYRLSTRTSVSLRYRYGSNMPVPGYFNETGGGLTLGPTRNALRLPAYSRLDLRATRTYDFRTRRLTLFAEVMNVLNRENVGLTDGTVRSDASVTGFVETLLPVLPSVGLRIEF